jgi:hypothetical protein
MLPSLPLLLLVGESGTACGDIATLWMVGRLGETEGRLSDDVVCWVGLMGCGYTFGSDNEDLRDESLLL